MMSFFKLINITCIFLIKQVNVSRYSRVADHCTQYALSNSTDQSFKSTCAHDHDLLCQRCQDLKDVLSDINMAIQNSQFEDEYDKEDALYTFQEAVRAIHLWKSHQLGPVNQDAARTDFIGRLNKNSVLLIQDWAMKFLPRQYREWQGEWFAKKGFSWHITVAIRKEESEMETQAFMHVVEQCHQGSPL